MSANGDAFVRLGELHVQRAAWAAVIAAVQRGIEKGRLEDPGNAELLLGIAHYSRKDFASAVPFFELSAKRRPLAGSYLQAIAHKAEWHRAFRRRGSTRWKRSLWPQRGSTVFLWAGVPLCARPRREKNRLQTAAYARVERRSARFRRSCLEPIERAWPTGRSVRRWRSERSARRRPRALKIAISAGFSGHSVLVSAHEVMVRSHAGDTVQDSR